MASPADRQHVAKLNLQNLESKPPAELTSSPQKLSAGTSAKIQAQRSGVKAGGSKRFGGGVKQTVYIDPKGPPPDVIGDCMTACLDVVVGGRGSVTPALAGIASKPKRQGATACRLDGRLGAGLKTILCVAHALKCPALATVAVNSGTFPPFRYDIGEVKTTDKSDNRTVFVVVAPATECVGSWWHEDWLAPAMLSERRDVLLFAKVAAAFLRVALPVSMPDLPPPPPVEDDPYGQDAAPGSPRGALSPRGSMSPRAMSPRGKPPPPPLPTATAAATKQKKPKKGRALIQNIVISGYSFGGCIAACYSMLLPAEAVGAVVTFAAPPCFAPSDWKKPRKSVNIVSPYDLIPHLTGHGVEFMKKVTAKLLAHGALVPVMPSSKALAAVSKYVVMGAVLNVVLQKDSKELPVAFLPIDLKRSIDLRVATTGMTVSVYCSLVLRAIEKAVDALPVPEPEAGIAQLTAANGEITASSPACALEFDVAAVRNSGATYGNTLETFVLMFPKVVMSAVRGDAQLPSAFAPTPLGVVTKLEACGDTMESASSFFRNVPHAIWRASWCAKQAAEFSGGLPITHEVAEAFLKPIWSLFATPAHIPSPLSKHASTPAVVSGLSEETRRLMQQPDGYHLGWTVGIASTVRSVGKSSIIAALTTKKLSSTAFGGAAQERNRQVGFAKPVHMPPATRVKWAPPEPGSSKRGSAVFSTADSLAPAHDLSTALLLQMYLQEIRFDDSPASVQSIRTVPELVWVVSDRYSLEHLRARLVTHNTAAHTDVLRAVVYAPKDTAPPDPDVHDMVRALCDQHLMYFAFVDTKQHDSVAAFQRVLAQWMVSRIPLPVDPALLPKYVEIGTLFTLSTLNVTKFIEQSLAELPRCEPEPSEKETEPPAPAVPRFMQPIHRKSVVKA